MPTAVWRSVSSAPPADEPLFGDKPAAPAAAAAASAKRSIMASIRTPNDPEAGPLLVSDDSKALLVVIELTTEFLSRDNWPTIDKIRSLIGHLGGEKKIPAGLDITLTGSAMIGRDHVEGEMKSAHATEVLTIVLVITLLLLIYRAAADRSHSTDYCLPGGPAIHPRPVDFGKVRLHHFVRRDSDLHHDPDLRCRGRLLHFLYRPLPRRARSRQASGRGSEPGHLRGGAAITASAATVIIGIGMMVFAQFGKFHEAGYAVPFSIFLVLCALLTFSPALLRLAGHWAFWPRHIDKIDRSEQPAGSEQSGLELRTLIRWEKCGIGSGAIY